MDKNINLTMLYTKGKIKAKFHVINKNMETCSEEGWHKMQQN